MTFWQILLLVGVAGAALAAGVFLARRNRAAIDSEAPTFWGSLGGTLARNPISAFAVICVAAIAVFLGIMSDRLLTVLESSQWCGKAIQAEKISPGSTYVGLTTCVELLKIQLQAIATGFHIGFYAYSFSLIVLIVVVVAGARASGKLLALEFNMSRHDDAVAGAEHVVEAAKEAEAEVKDATVKGA